MRISAICPNILISAKQYVKSFPTKQLYILETKKRSNDYVENFHMNKHLPSVIK